MVIRTLTDYRTSENRHLQAEPGSLFSMMMQAVFQTGHYYFLQHSPPDGLPQLSSRPQQVFPRGRAGILGIETTDSFFSSSALPQCTHTASSFEA
jgi:hypothetical protein